MAVNYSNTLKTNRMQLVADLIASKTVASSTGTALAGSLEIGTDSGSNTFGTVLATFTLSATPGTVSGTPAVLTFTNPSNVTASASGTAGCARIKNNAGTVIVDKLTVGTSGTDVTINSTSISSGQTVSITSATITHG